LDDDVLGRLQQYVNTILAAPQKKKTTRPHTNTKVTHKKETPKRRLQKEAPKKVNRRKRSTATGSRKRTSYTSKQKKQQALLAATLATRNTFVSAELMQQIFMKEEIVRANKSSADEDEEVDILD